MSRKSSVNWRPDCKFTRRHSPSKIQTVPHLISDHITWWSTLIFFWSCFILDLTKEGKFWGVEHDLRELTGALVLLLLFVCSCHGGDRRFTKNAPEMRTLYMHAACSSILLEADLWNPLWGRFLNKKLMTLGSISAGERWKLWDEKQWKKSNIFGFWRTLLNRIPGLFWLLKASDSWKRKGFQFLFTAHFYI